MKFCQTMVDLKSFMFLPQQWYLSENVKNVSAIQEDDFVNKWTRDLEISFQKLEYND